MGKNTLFLMKKVNVEKRFILFSASHDVSVMIVNLLHLQLSILPRSLGSDSGHSFRPSNAIQEIIADSKKWEVKKLAATHMRSSTLCVDIPMSQEIMKSTFKSLGTRQTCKAVSLRIDMLDRGLHRGNTQIHRFRYCTLCLEIEQLLESRNNWQSPWIFLPAWHLRNSQQSSDDSVCVIVGMSEIVKEFFPSSNSSRALILSTCEHSSDPVSTLGTNV